MRHHEQRRAAQLFVLRACKRDGFVTAQRRSVDLVECDQRRLSYLWLRLVKRASELTEFYVSCASGFAQRAGETALLWGEKLVAEMLVRIAERGVSILLVEQKLTIALTISRRVYVMGHGRVVFEGAPDDLRRAENVRKEWLEV